MEQRGITFMKLTAEAIKTRKITKRQATILLWLIVRVRSLFEVLTQYGHKRSDEVPMLSEVNISVSVLRRPCGYF